MKINSIIYRYIFREMLPPFGITLVFFSFIFLMTQIIQIMNMVVNHRVGLSVVGWMILYTLPFFMEFIIPMSIMMSVLLTFLRLSGDNEILALKNGGLSVYDLLPPVMLFCLLGALLTASMALYGLPWGRMSIKKLTIQVATTNLDIGIKERTFNDSFKGVMLYVNKMDAKTRTLSDVFIEDSADPGRHHHRCGPQGPDGKQSGDPSVSAAGFTREPSTRWISKAGPSTRCDFDTYDIHLDTRQAMAAVKSGPNASGRNVPDRNPAVSGRIHRKKFKILPDADGISQEIFPSLCLHRPWLSGGSAGDSVQIQQAFFRHQPGDILLSDLLHPAVRRLGFW